MKVCVVSTNIVPYFRGDMFGGAERQAAVILKALDKRGVDCTLVTSDLSKNVELPYRAENAYYSSDGVPILRFFTPRMTGILRALERVDADVYYQRNAGMITGVVAWFCRRNNRVFVYGAGSDQEFDKKKAIPGFRDRTMFFYGLRKADAVVVQNQAQQDALRAMLDLPSVIIPNGVESHPPEQKTDTVLWIGGLTTIKRPDVFLSVVKELPDVEFSIVGGPSGGEVSFGRHIQERAAKIPNLTVVGRLAPDEARRHVSRAALLVNTSAVEGFPNAFLEAWDAATPVVSFVDVDGLISRYEVGKVCADESEMIRAIRELMQDSDRRAAMGSRATQLVRDQFSSDTLGECYMSFFADLLKTHAAEPSRR